MPEWRRGLYEALITEALAEQLGEVDEELVPSRDPLRAVEAPDRIALHLARIIERVIRGIDAKKRVGIGTGLARHLIRHIDEIVKGPSNAASSPVLPAEVLRAVRALLPDGTPETIHGPLIPLLDTTLLTNAPGEPRVGNQISSEIASADRIEVVMAFIRRSGIAPLTDALKRHCAGGRSLRVLTTTYTGSTEARALEILRDLGAEIRVSYDTTTTRLHAKAWLFHRGSGFSTAYVGSSNLTHSAQVSGLEWNVRVSGARNPDVISKVAAVFESYWNSPEFVAYDPDHFAKEASRSTTDRGATYILSPIELRPEPFQERLLEQIAVSRQQGHHRNLLVSATGTGKTVMAAVDYARLRTSLPRARLLFVAHREEILEQSKATFCHALRDTSFGERWFKGKRPTDYEHVFASIQSLRAAGLSNIDPTHFDVVIVDEFHHAAAPSYRAVLDHLRPTELLGLTATPERSDGLPLLGWFDNRIAAELRLWDAIDQHRLSPFVYYGIHDGLDLRDIPWRRGSGYDVQGLTNLYTATDAWARQVIKQLTDRVDDPHQIRALGLCVSVAHARYMARIFGEANIPAIAVWGDSPSEDRKQALRDLAARRVNVVFSVDIFNEGVDVPSVDTLLMLRPTDSPTLFLQQLGRGLRRTHGKHVCTVLDFVGHHRKEFRFDRRLRALLGGSRKDLVRQIEQGFPFLPAGCHMELDRVASEAVLTNIREATPSRWPAKVEELRLLRRDGDSISLTTYLDHTGLELTDVYAGSKSWSDMLQDAGATTLDAGPQEKVLRKAIGRLLHVDDRRRLDGYRALLASPLPPIVTLGDDAALSEQQRRLTRMVVASVTDQALTKTTPFPDGCDLLWRHPQVRAELVELFTALADHVDHLHTPVANRPDLPLQVHARYTRLEVLAAFNVGTAAKVAPWQTGVYWVEAARADLLAFTLDKTAGSFSPTTRYRDYAITPDLIHWESQSATRAESATGQRYQQHATMGSDIMLFARLRNDDRAFWFLGPATYVRHEGELPMAITWRLQHPLPGDLFSAFAAAVA